MKAGLQTAALTIGILLLVAVAIHGALRQTQRAMPPWDVPAGAYR